MEASFTLRLEAYKEMVADSAACKHVQIVCKAESHGAAGFLG